MRTTAGANATNVTNVTNVTSVTTVAIKKNSNAKNNGNLSTKALRDEVIGIYQQVFSLLKIIGIEPTCVVKNAFVKYFGPSITKYVDHWIYGRAITFARKRDNLTSWLIDKLLIPWMWINMPIVSQNFHQERVRQVMLGRKNDIIKYALDDSYDMADEFDNFVMEVLDTLDDQGLINIRNYLANQIRINLITQDVACKMTGTNGKKAI